jgi:hypothetical protein
MRNALRCNGGVRHGGQQVESGDSPRTSGVNADGETIELSSLWADKPVVLSFLRHFG